MGKLVAFWSPYEGKAKVTSSLCAVAGMLGMEYPELSIAISHIGSDCMELGEKLDCRHRHNIKEEIYGKAGITSVKLNFRQSVLSSDKIRRSAVPLLMKSLFFYPNAEEKRYDELTDYIVTQVIPGEFDALLLDLKSGFNGYSKRFLEAADFLIVVLPQDPRAWENFMLRESEYMSGKKYFILLGGYLENSKFGRKYFLRNKEEKLQGEFIGGVPCNTGFFDAMAEGNTLDFFYKNQRVRKKEENYEFIFQTKKIAGFLRKNIFFP